MAFGSIEAIDHLNDYALPIKTNNQRHVYYEILE